jgi:hypothetical protein
VSELHEDYTPAQLHPAEFLGETEEGTQPGIVPDPAPTAAHVGYRPRGPNARPPHDHDPSLAGLPVGVLAEMVTSEIRQLLRELTKNTDITAVSDVLIGATNQPHATQSVPDIPIPGAHRVILADRRQGGSYAAAAATPLAVAGQSNGRSGLSVQNTGANPMTVYLGTVAEVNSAPGSLPQFVLAAGSPPWNGLLTKVLWLGDVTVLSTLGTTIAVAAV